MIDKENAVRSVNPKLAYVRKPAKPIFPPANVRSGRLVSSTVPTMNVLFTNADQLTASKKTTDTKDQRTQANGHCNM